MTEPGVLVITGASGTVGTCVLDHLAPIWPGWLCAVGRARPPRLPAADFLAYDLTDPAATGAAAARLAAGPHIAGLICIAGVDCRASLDQVTVAALTASMQVNCFAHLQLPAAPARHTGAAAALGRRYRGLGRARLGRPRRPAR
jgi:NADP-dependent 3-hydroxy acid dehydrogenase YdfG